MNKTIRIIGVPMDLGQSHRGVSMGPGAIRYSELGLNLRKLGYKVEDIGDIQVPIRDVLSESGKIKFLPDIKKVCELAYGAANKAILDNCIPVFLGGDHSISIGTIGGITDQRDTGVLWIDAHGDFNTSETSTSGNVHGMALASLIGNGEPELVNIGRKGAKLKPQNVVLIAVRNLDPKEQQLLKTSNIKVYTMRDIDELGISEVAHRAIKHLSHLPDIHVSLDMDSIDPMYAPGVGTPVNGGITYREVHLFMEIVADSCSLSSMDLVEINPMLDVRNRTALIAVELAVSIFGKGIL